MPVHLSNLSPAILPSIASILCVCCSAQYASRDSCWRVASSGHPAWLPQGPDPETCDLAAVKHRKYLIDRLLPPTLLLRHAHGVASERPEEACRAALRRLRAKSTDELERMLEEAFEHFNEVCCGLEPPQVCSRQACVRNGSNGHTCGRVRHRHSAKLMFRIQVNPQSILNNLCGLCA